MKPVLLLIDLQQDFLSEAGLEPAAGLVVSAAARLLMACRSRGVPVVHLLLTVQPHLRDRMPHWKVADKRRCIEGSPGHSPPDSLMPVPGEPVIRKQFFNGFRSGELARSLESFECDTILLAGVHLHGCVRATALDAYERGYKVLIADDAVASDDPLHAAITRRYLQGRAAECVRVDRLVAMLDGANASNTEFTHFSPDDRHRELWRLTGDDRAAISAEASAARQAGAAWRGRDPRARAGVLREWAAMLRAECEAVASMIVRDIGKPISQARAEVRRSSDLLEATAGIGVQQPNERGNSGVSYRYVPLGVVAIITPFNNPVAIPVGKIGPALMYGNTVVWKPAPAASMIAGCLLEIARRAGVPQDALVVCVGDRATALLLAEDENVDGVTVSGSALAGYAIQETCARRHIPFQAELGGNNAAIVWEDAELPAAAAKIAAAAFGFAGQRCTANRRVVVAESRADRFVEELELATSRLRWGDPSNPDTIIGPLVCVEKRDEVCEMIRRCETDGLVTRVPHRNQMDSAQLMERGAYFPPTIVLADDPSHECVQEESFAPVLVVQPAADFGRALELCNGVRQGLVAALFASSSALRERFLGAAQAGVLKIDEATADADARSPLGGWKASGVGPAEHGPSDREFYCRVQTLYEADEVHH